MNYQLFELLNRDAGRFDHLDDVMEFAATRLISGVFAVAAVLMARALWQRRVRPVAELGVTLVLAFLISALVARFSAELRPFQTHHVHQLIPHGPGVSLPSDHATAAFAVAFGIGLFVDRRWGIVLTVAALAIGVARVWVGVHYPGDVAAGALIAVLAVAAVLAGNRWRPPRGRAVNPAGLRESR